MAEAEKRREEASREATELALGKKKAEGDAENARRQLEEAESSHTALARLRAQLIAQATQASPAPHWKEVEGDG